MKQPVRACRCAIGPRRRLQKVASTTKSFRVQRISHTVVRDADEETSVEILPPSGRWRGDFCCISARLVALGTAGAVSL